MGQTYTQHHYHLVFSTKGREPTLVSGLRERMWEYLGGFVRGEGGIAHQVGGLADHVHLLVTLRAAEAVADFVCRLKSVSSGWAHDTFPDVGIWWQGGYSSFTVSHSALEPVRKYIERQEAAHRERTFQEELRLMLRLHGIAYKEEYLWE
jgi:REP element-mobilizing transposase RayT